jgi:hypothetical protein
MDDKRNEGLGGISGTATGQNVQSHWNTPPSDLKNVDTTGFDDYVLIGKQGDSYQVFGSAGQEESSQLLEDAGTLF